MINCVLLQVLLLTTMFLLLFIRFSDLFSFITKRYAIIVKLKIIAYYLNCNLLCTYQNYTLKVRTLAKCDNKVGCEGPTDLNFFFNLLIDLSFLLLLCGDIHCNPGPTQLIDEASLTEYYSKRKTQVKVIHCNLQNLSCKFSEWKSFVSKYQHNTIFAITEIWLTTKDCNNLWNIDKTFYDLIRADRDLKTSGMKKGGGVLFLIPKKFKSKVRSDLINTDAKHFESLWVECTLDNTKYLLNLSYCPQKNTLRNF